MNGRLIQRALAAGVFVLALVAREAQPHTLPTLALGPRPDALEYVAGAQAIAQYGRYFLQVGPERLRPRYPPGFSMVLAPAVALGVPAESLWRVTGLFGAALAVLVGGLAATAVGRLRPGHRRAELWAFALAGTLWALAPAAVAVGRAVLSDEPATFFLLLSLALAGRVMSPPSAVLAALAGASWAIALAIRPVVALPALLVLAPLALAQAWPPASNGSHRARGLLAALLGAVAVVGLVVALLLRSGLPAWPWDGYSLWVPERHEVPGRLWSVDYALRGDPQTPRQIEGRTLGNLEFVARSALGLPGLPLHSTPGPGWPALGLLLVALVGPWVSQRRRLEAGVQGLWLGLVLWSAFHFAFYGGYFFAAARFLLPLFAVSAVAVGAGLGVLLTRPGRVVRTVAALLALLAVFVTTRLTLRLEPQIPRSLAVPAAATVDAWLALSDAERAAGKLPFDPVHAQALGLLDPDRLTAVHSWGELPATIHVRRLRARGHP